MRVRVGPRHSASAIVPREGDDAFLGIVRAIAKEVAAEQGRNGASFTTECLYGEAHERCVVELRRFDPSRNSSFARWCFQTVKKSMIRDIVRGRFKDKGQKVNGDDRPTRRHIREVIGGEIVVRKGYGGHDGGLGALGEEQPEWWEYLTPQQQEIAGFMLEGVRFTRIALYLGIEVEQVIEQVQEMRTVLVDIGVAKAEEDDEDIEDDVRAQAACAHTGGGWWERRIGGGACLSKAG